MQDLFNIVMNSLGNKMADIKWKEKKTNIFAKLRGIDQNY